MQKSAQSVHQCSHFDTVPACDRHIHTGRHTMTVNTHI